MPRQRYDAFLLRHWHLPGGAERVEIRHIASGAAALVTSLPAALDWMVRRDWPETPPPAPADPPESGEHGQRE